MSGTVSISNKTKSMFETNGNETLSFYQINYTGVEVLAWFRDRQKKDRQIDR
jgi:hypothetical protein